MLKMFVFLLPLLFGAPATNDLTTETTECQAPGWLQKTGATSNSYSMAWGAVSGASDYEVWYERGAYTSPVQPVAQTSHTFGNLEPGSYTFYVRTVCDGGVSSFIGNSDILEL